MAVYATPPQIATLAPQTGASTPRAGIRTTLTSRGAALFTAITLIVVAVVHLIDGRGSLDDTFYIGALELALAAACVPLAIVLVVYPARAVWIAIASLVSVALALYVASRTVGLPGATDDIGAWGEPLGLLNLVSELAVVALAGRSLTRRAARGRGR